MNAPRAVRDPFVSAEWLANNPDTVVADCRWYLDGRSASAAYAAGHIPGARFVDLDADLAAPSGPAGRHPLPSPEAFSAAMRRIGVGHDSVVVAYDDTGGHTAGRLWWMLDSVGVETYVLAGGIDSWPGELAPGPDSGGPSGTLIVDEWPADHYVTIDEVAASLDDPAVVVVDGRSADRFQGLENPIDPRLGHIPGAVSAPATTNLVDRSPASIDALAERYRRLGIDHDDEVIAYCGSGVSACLDLLALRRIGHPGSRLYVGSWSEWALDPDRPVETGEGEGST